MSASSPPDQQLEFPCPIVFESFCRARPDRLRLRHLGERLPAAGHARPDRLRRRHARSSRRRRAHGCISFFQNFVQIAVLMLAWAIVLLAFFILAVQLFVTLIEFKLTTLAGFVLIPFGLFGKTAFLAERVLGNVVASGIKVLVLAVIVGIGTGAVRRVHPAWPRRQPPTLEDALAMVLAALALLGLGIFGPGIATGLVSGAPQLGAGAAAGTALLRAVSALPAPRPPRGRRRPCRSLPADGSVSPASTSRRGGRRAPATAALRPRPCGRRFGVRGSPEHGGGSSAPVPAFIAAPDPAAPRASDAAVRQLPQRPPAWAHADEAQPGRQPRRSPPPPMPCAPATTAAERIRLPSKRRT